LDAAAGALSRQPAASAGADAPWKTSRLPDGLLASSEAVNLFQAQKAAVEAARAAGALMHRHLGSAKKVTAETAHDIKLELDVRSQWLIEKTLRAAFPQVPMLGEEGYSGDINASYRWVVDPIDGTVNFAYGIPHACVSIALQCRSDKCRVSSDKSSRTPMHPPVTCHSSHATLLGVVYDPFQDELWTAIRGQRARLNGRPIHVSHRAHLSEAIVSIGFAKNREYINSTLPYFSQLVRRVRKIRMMGAAALGLAYVATGRFDAYIERGISIWDITAGGLILECAGGEFWREPIPGKHRYHMVASNGLLRRKLRFGDLFK
jgi:myo-inositol-1(or 4)-monophosphatase